jgi:hypothetical protein
MVLRLSRPQGHSAAGRIKSMKKPNDPIGNRIRDLAACSVVLLMLKQAVNVVTGVLKDCAFNEFKLGLKLDKRCSVLNYSNAGIAEVRLGALTFTALSCVGGDLRLGRSCVQGVIANVRRIHTFRLNSGERGTISGRFGIQTRRLLVKS